MKQESGITLIALVITIIVLLILAGVSLAMVAGGNGILTKAGVAAESTPIADAKSNIGVEIADYIAEYYDAKYAKGLGGTNNTTTVTAINNATSVGDYVQSKLNQGAGYYAENVKLTITEAGPWTLTLSLKSGEAYTDKATATLNTDGSIAENKWTNNK